VCLQIDGPALHSLFGLNRPQLTLLHIMK
jgi:hypothetical protein